MPHCPWQHIILHKEGGAEQMEKYEEIWRGLEGRCPALHSVKGEVLAAFQEMRECFLGGGKL